MPREIFQEEREITRPGLLLVITGPTGSGKTTVAGEILKRYPEFSQVVTYTTRPPREDEIPGRDYHFVIQEEFRGMQEAGEFIETESSYPPHFYGTPMRGLEPLREGKNLLLVVNTPAAAQIDQDIRQWLAPDINAARAQLKRTVVVYIGVPDARTLIKRLEERGMPREEIRKRLRKDIEDWRRYSSSFSHIIKNRPTALKETLKQVEGLIRRTS